jgi:hypothetical protein
VFIQYLAIGYFSPEQAEDISRRRDAYFHSALKRITDEIYGKKEAIMQSNAWNPQIKAHLDSLPVFVSRQAVSHTDCQACNRRAHTSSWEVELTGVPYNASRFWKGKWIDNYPPEGDEEREIYNVGRFCHTRTELYHRLQHFPNAMYSKICTYFEKLDDDVEPDAALAQILDDEDWLSKQYTRFKNLRDETMKFLSSTAGAEKD